MSGLSVSTRYLPVFSLLLGAIISSPAASANSSVFINEIHYDNSGTDVAESIEIAGPAGTDLNGWSIVLYNGSNGQVYNTTNLNGLITDSGNGFGFIAETFPVNGIQNGSPDGIALVDHFNNVMQFLSYEGVLTAIDGPAAGLTSTDIGVSESGSTAAGMSLQLGGSGVSSADFTWRSAQPASFGLINSAQSFNGSGAGPATNIVINEIDADNAGTDAAEFIELYDGGAGNTSLDGLVVVLFNGNDDASYNSINLTGFSTSAEGYFVICGNSANVDNCQLDISPDTNLIQNGADAVALYMGDAADYTNDTPLSVTNLLDAVVYGTNDADDAALLTLLNPNQPQLNDTQEESLQRCANGSGGQRNTESFAAYLPTPGSVNICELPAELQLIHDIQGTGTTSPLVGRAVIVEAVVVGDLQGNDKLNGFYLQEENADVDDNAETSEGIFVYAPGSVDLQAGDVVRVTGNVTEFSNLTEINNVTSIEIIGHDNSVTPATLDFPVPSTAYMERFEGMLIQLSQPMVISEYFNYDRYGEMVLALPLEGNTRLYQPTAVVMPGIEANTLQAENALRRITLDDGSTRSNPAVLRHPNGQAFSLDNRFRGGDVVTDILGVMDYRYGAYRIQPVAAANHLSNNPRSSVPEAIDGDIKVASFNVLNYFTTLDNGSKICGPDETLGCRGADNEQEFDRQRAKIIDALFSINADIVGLIELENNASTSIVNLVDTLNSKFGEKIYDYIDTGVIGSDAIKVGIIYQPEKVKPVGAYKVLDASIDSRFVDDKNRPVLAQTFTSLDSAARFTVAVNHLKSKGSACDALGDIDTGDGQGNCNKTRENAVLAEIDWLASTPTGTDDPDVLIIGDLNSYAMEDPIKAFENGVDGLSGTNDDYHNLIALFNQDKAYSYVFNGQFAYLDYAIANSTLSSQVSGVTEWHINADEPDILDYNTDYKPAEQIALYEANSFRSSDHDPVIIGLELEASIDDLLAFMQQSIADKSLTGTGHRPARKLEKFKHLMTKAGYLMAKNHPHAACKVLKVAQYKSDGERRPHDFVAGSSASVLSGMIANYRQANCTKHQWQSNAHSHRNNHH